LNDLKKLRKAILTFLAGWGAGVFAPFLGKVLPYREMRRKKGG
jgi:hypothetical protein